jgi:hypothetical protein
MATDTAADRDWFIAGRWEEFEGEGRVNLLRLVGLTAFYAVELANYHGLDLGFFRMPAVVQRPFHLAMTFLVLGWAMLCLAVYFCRRNGVFPAYLKFVVYFLLIAAAGLRFSLPLVWFASGGAVACYLFLLGFARWGEVPGWEKSDQTVPRHAQVIFVLALALAGVVVGQVVRRVRHLAEHFADRRAARGGAP